DAYHRDGKSEAGPAATVAHSHLVRYKAASTSSPKADDDPAYPAFGAEPYGSALSSWEPRTGPVVTFFMLGNIYRPLDHAAALRYLRQAADAQAKNDLDLETRLLATSTLIDMLGSMEEDVQEIERRFAQLLNEPGIIGREHLFAFVIFG